MYNGAIDVVCRRLWGKGAMELGNKGQLSGMHAQKNMSQPLNLLSYAGKETRTLRRETGLPTFEQTNRKQRHNTPTEPTRTRRIPGTPSVAAGQARPSPTPPRPPPPPPASAANARVTLLPNTLVREGTELASDWSSSELQLSRPSPPSPVESDERPSESESDSEYRETRLSLTAAVVSLIPGDPEVARFDVRRLSELLLPMLLMLLLFGLIDGRLEENRLSRWFSSP